MESNEKKFEVKEDKKKGILKVRVTLPLYTGNNYVGCRDGTVREYLRNNNISFGDCIQSNSIGNQDGPTTAEWLFIMPGIEKTLDKALKPVVSSSRAKRTKKSSA